MGVVTRLPARWERRSIPTLGYCLVGGCASTTVGFVVYHLTSGNWLATEGTYFAVAFMAGLFCDEVLALVRRSRCRRTQPAPVLQLPKSK